jgi:tetratricopeptide (TPR) repeat protein
MQSYSVRDVERVLQLSRATIRRLIHTGFVTPARGARQEYRFSFQDLIVLRTARALIQAKVPRKRIHRSLRELRRHLPDATPLSGLCIRAIGDRVVVREGQTHWDVGDGQYLLGFDVSIEHGELKVSNPPAPIIASASRAVLAPSVSASASGEDIAASFEHALELEVSDPLAALEGYQRVVTREPGYTAAWINRGRLLHALGRMSEAESLYRLALERCGADGLLLFNLAVLLEDLERPSAALETYQSAIDAEPGLADAHYNLARLYEHLGDAQHAIRHLGHYRRLTGEARW